MYFNIKSKLNVYPHFLFIISSMLHHFQYPFCKFSVAIVSQM